MIALSTRSLFFLLSLLLFGSSAAVTTITLLGLELTTTTSTGITVPAPITPYYSIYAVAAGSDGLTTYIEEIKLSRDARIIGVPLAVDIPTVTLHATLVQGASEYKIVAKQTAGSMVIGSESNSNDCNFDEDGEGECHVTFTAWFGEDPVSTSTTTWTGTVGPAYTLAVSDIPGQATSINLVSSTSYVVPRAATGASTSLLLMMFTVFFMQWTALWSAPSPTMVTKSLFFLLSLPFFVYSAVTTVTLLGVQVPTPSESAVVGLIPTYSDTISAIGVGSDGSTTYIEEIQASVEVHVFEFPTGTTTDSAGSVKATGTLYSTTTIDFSSTMTAFGTLVQGASGNKYVQETTYGSLTIGVDNECHWGEDGTGDCIYKIGSPNGTSVDTITTSFTGTVVPVATFVVSDISGNCAAVTTVTLFGVQPITASGTKAPARFFDTYSAVGVGSDGRTTYVEEIRQSQMLRVTELEVGTTTLSNGLIRPSGTTHSTMTIDIPTTTFFQTLVQGATEYRKSYDLTAAHFPNGNEANCHWDTEGNGECELKAWSPYESTWTTTFTGTVGPVFTLVVSDIPGQASSTARQAGIDDSYNYFATVVLATFRAAVTTVTLMGVQPTTTTTYFPGALPSYSYTYSAVGAGSDGLTTYVEDILQSQVLNVLIVSKTTVDGAGSVITTGTSYMPTIVDLSSTATIHATLVQGASEYKYVVENTGEDPFGNQNDCHWNKDGKGECVNEAWIPGGPTTTVTETYTGTVAPLYTLVVSNIPGQASSTSFATRQAAIGVSTSFTLLMITAFFVIYGSI
ncbi:hypothetical protein BDQ17DRAFT_1433704 [Cyathus striatus]|nr:hypothetical protein BDQ17DRAFT_1433704 [Cyathus striatus]